MPVSYDTHKMISEVHIDAYNQVHPGSGGCGSFTGLTNGSTRLAPTGSQGMYEPIRIIRSKPKVPAKGRLPGSVRFMFTPYHTSETTYREHLLNRKDGNNADISYRRHAAYGKSGTA